MRSMELALLVCVAMLASGGSLAATGVTQAAGTVAEDDPSCEAAAVSFTFDHAYERFQLQVDSACRSYWYGNLPLHPSPETWSDECEAFDDGTIRCSMTYGSPDDCGAIVCDPDDVGVWTVDVELGPEGAFEFVLDDDETVRLTGTLDRVDV